MEQRKKIKPILFLFLFIACISVIFWDFGSKQSSNDTILLKYKSDSEIRANLAYADPHLLQEIIYEIDNARENPVIREAKLKELRSELLKFFNLSTVLFQWCSPLITAQYGQDFGSETQAIKYVVKDSDLNILNAVSVSQSSTVIISLGLIYSLADYYSTVKKVDLSFYDRIDAKVAFSLALNFILNHERVHILLDQSAKIDEADSVYKRLYTIGAPENIFNNKKRNEVRADYIAVVCGNVDYRMLKKMLGELADGKTNYSTLDFPTKIISAISDENKGLKGDKYHIPWEKRKLILEKIRQDWHEQWESSH